MSIGMQLVLFILGAFRLYDVDNDGYITRQEMYNIVEAIYQMVVSADMYKVEFKKSNCFEKNIS